MRYKIFKDGEEINIIVASADFIEDYCAKNGFTYKEEILPDPAPVPEPEPTQMDRIEAQVTYTAMMTDTLLEV